jgi:glycosyltransferase involved in cell wall biosynthesis
MKKKLKLLNDVPIISFCIPTYNRAGYVKDCINAITQINSDKIEIIVSDNFSSDQTREEVLKLASKDSRIKYFRNTVNIGQSRNIVKSFKLATGKYIYLTSDEDLVNHHFFNKYIDMIDSSDWSLVVGSIFNNQDKKYYIKEVDNVALKINDIKGLDQVAYRFYLSGILFNRELIDNDILYKYTSNDDNLYAYIPAIIMCIKNGNIAQFSKIICYQNISNIQYTDYELKGIAMHYTDPLSRIKQFQFWIEMTIELVDSKKYQRELIGSLGNWAGKFYASQVFKKYEKNKIESFYRFIIGNSKMRNKFLFSVYKETARQYLIRAINYLTKKVFIYSKLKKLYRLIVHKPHR